MKNTFLALLVTSAFSISSAFAGPMASDVTYEGEIADSVWGPFAGNDNGGINGLGIAGDVDWTLLDKTDGSSSPYLGVTFTLTADWEPEETFGTWTLSWVETIPDSLPLFLDFAFVTKSGTSFAAYVFESIDFTSSPTSGDGTFQMALLNNGGQIAELSHASVYARAGTIIDIPSGVPEPGMLVLFGTALVGLGLAKKRKFKA